MSRIANYKIDEAVRNLQDFTNYNGTIYGTNVFTEDGAKYIVVHWNTKVLEYSPKQGLTYLLTGYRSQTTSTLTGRLLRSLPRQQVLEFINTLPACDDKKRFTRMVR